MNLSIYDYELPDEDTYSEIEFKTIIPFKIKKPLCVHDNVLSLLVDVDEDNIEAKEPQVLNIVRTRSFHDFHDFCDRPAFVVAYYTYLGCKNKFHYFVKIT